MDFLLICIDQVLPIFWSAVDTTSAAAIRVPMRFWDEPRISSILSSAAIDDASAPRSMLLMVGKRLAIGGRQEAQRKPAFGTCRQIRSVGVTFASQC